MTTRAHANPWTLLDAETVYDNPWIRVEHHRVVNPSGKPGIYGKICFKHRAVAILALDTADRLVLVGQYRYTLGAYSWELPMGGAPLAVDPMLAARRELREETGLTARRWRELMRLHTSNSVTDEVAHVYIATDLRAGRPAPEDTEQLSVETIAFASALERVRRGEITDAVSAAAILRLASEAGSRAASRAGASHRG